MTLLEGELGKRYYVRDIVLENTVRRRFEILGMTRGAMVTVINKKKSGALILKIRGTRFAVGKKFAEGIIVGGEPNGRND